MASATALTLLGEPAQAEVRDILADTWEATDSIGRRVATAAETGPPKPDKTVALFYYIWLGAHGFDTHFNPGHGPNDFQGTGRPEEGKTYQSPYLIPRILEAPLGERPWGPPNAFHHWAEPLFGFYLSDDRWVIRRHARMLTDAGIDMLIFDVTNTFQYPQIVEALLEELEALRKAGVATPKVSFMTNPKPKGASIAMTGLWEVWYRQGKFREHWAYWQGKPLILTNPEVLTPEQLDFFTVRRSWAWTRFINEKPAPWFKDGQHAWPWLDHVPQGHGWDKDPKVPEQVSVATAQHPLADIGKSYSGRKQPMPPSSSEGIYFAEQWKSALETDPPFLLITQWNEWIAMRFINEETKGFKYKQFAGLPVGPGDSIFVDGFNHEFNRDIEPMRDGWEDNYYYQMVDGIRRFKGARAVEPAGPPKTITADFASWNDVTPTYYDTEGDTDHRNHPGWGSAGPYVETSGRNDIVEAKVSRDADYVYFYAKTAAPLTAPGGGNWMELFLAFDELDGKARDWEGFHFRVSLEPTRKEHYVLEKALGGIHWRGLAYVDYTAKGNELYVRVPRELLGEVATGENLSFRFKWSDNRQTNRALDWLIHGDTAPNGRFTYRYRTAPFSAKNGETGNR